MTIDHEPVDNHRRKEVILGRCHHREMSAAFQGQN